MVTLTRIIRLIGITGLVVWLGIIGWAARTTHAQNGGQAPLPPPPIPSQRSGREEPKGMAAPALSERVTPVLADSSKIPPPPPIRNKLTSATDQDLSLATGPAVHPDAGAETPAATIDDPEKTAQSFVERNQKEAESQLKTLTNESEELRARLLKLEAGIRRWQALVDALKRSQDLVAKGDAAQGESGAEQTSQASPNAPDGANSKPATSGSAEATAPAVDPALPASQPAPAPNPATSFTPR
jgi:hypothetical protein